MLRRGFSAGRKLARTIYLRPLSLAAHTARATNSHRANTYTSMRTASIILFAIMATGFLAGLLKPPNPTASLIVFTTMSTGIITNVCYIIAHHTGSKNQWCLPIGIPAGAVAGSVVFRSLNASDIMTLDPKGDLRPFWTLSKLVWKVVKCEASSIGYRAEKLWCEATRGH